MIYFTQFVFSMLHVDLISLCLVSDMEQLRNNTKTAIRTVVVASYYDNKSNNNTDSNGKKSHVEDRNLSKKFCLVKKRKDERMSKLM